MGVTASRDELLVLIDEQGRATAYPEDQLPQVVEILTTPATVKVSTYTLTGIADGLRTLQPGEPDHAMGQPRRRRLRRGRDVTRLEEDVTPLLPLDDDENVDLPPKGLDTGPELNDYGGADATRRNDAVPPDEADRASGTS